MTENGTTIPPLVSGGIMLSYNCSSACRHCMYRCSPTAPEDWMSLEMLDSVYSDLKSEPSLRSIHLAGGEPCLNRDLLLKATKRASTMGIPMDYVETNAGWCEDAEDTRRYLGELKDAGLPALLISVSMFHNEFIPFEHTRNCVEASMDVFGAHGTIVYMQHVYDMFEDMKLEGTQTLAEFMAKAGLTDTPEVVPTLYSLIKGGRVVSALRDFYEKSPADSFEGVRCSGDLLSTSHFHIDNYGNLITGCCAGLVVGKVGDLHPDVSKGSFPVFSMLCDQGPLGLMDMAVSQYGYKPREDGYIGKCDLCLHVRATLSRSGDFQELTPDFFYRGI